MPRRLGYLVPLLLLFLFLRLTNVLSFPSFIDEHEVEGLTACGYDVEDTVQWGGYRQRQDDDEGQWVAARAV